MQDLPQRFRYLGQFDVPLFGAGIPVPLLFVILIAVVMTLFLNRTIWGFRIYAVDGNEVASGLSGISTDRVKIMVYSLAGFLTAIGGTSLVGEEGTILGVLTGVSAYWLQAVQGLVIVVAIMLDQLRKCPR